MLRKASLWTVKLLEYRSIIHPLTTFLQDTLTTACQPIVSPDPVKGMHLVADTVLLEVTVNRYRMTIATVHLIPDTYQNYITFCLVHHLYQLILSRLTASKESLFVTLENPRVNQLIY